MTYKVLDKNIYTTGEYSIVPIRMEDRYDIMKWRNEQIYHLRQKSPLTIDGQDKYFLNVVSELFDKDQPNQILFSYMQNSTCIGYGGLVHINWADKNAEVSFVMDTVLERDFFEFHWLIYLSLLEDVAFKELKLHKIFTYAFDLRPHLYPIFEKAGFSLQARLKEHCYFEGSYKDVVIHGKFNHRPH
jgi:RimJ/RimL family protein N-acetyltransferase